MMSQMDDMEIDPKGSEASKHAPKEGENGEDWTQDAPKATGNVGEWNQDKPGDWSKG